MWPLAAAWVADDGGRAGGCGRGRRGRSRDGVERCSPQDLLISTVVQCALGKGEVRFKEKMLKALRGEGVGNVPERRRGCVRWEPSVGHWRGDAVWNLGRMGDLPER